MPVQTNLLLTLFLDDPVYLFALLKVDLQNLDGLGAAAAPVQLMLRAGAGRRLRTHIHVTEIGNPKSFFRERKYG